MARFGGDEFGILLEDIASERDAIETAERIAAIFARPFVLDGSEHFVTTSIGIALASGGELADELIRDADAAMYRAKERGRARYEVFDEGMRGRAIVATADGERPAPRARARRAAARLPAGRVAARTTRSSASRRCSAGTTPSAGEISPARVHPDRRGERADRADRPVGARAARAARPPQWYRVAARTRRRSRCR